MSLGEFHAQVPEAAPSTAAAAQPLARMNWAEEMEKVGDDQPPADYVFDRSQLPTAPKAVLAAELNMDLVPKNPPYTAFISNVSFEADEDKIRALFKDFKLENVRLPTNERGACKGFGYVQFSDRDSLITALGRTDLALNNRPIKISLDEHKSGGERPGGDRRMGGYAQSGEPLRSDESSWRRLPEPEPETTYPGSSKPYGQRSYGDQGKFQRGGDQQQRGGYQRRGGRGGGERHYQNRGDFQRGGGEYQSREGGSYQNRERGEYHHQNRSEYRPRLSDQGAKDHAEQQHQEHHEGEESSAGAQPVERPKLNLAPRTLPVEDASSSINANSSSIFGSAKPVNTAAREREIEERLKKEREAAALAAAAAAAAANSEENKTSSAHETSHHGSEHDTSHGEHNRSHGEHNRSHKTSVASDDQHRSNSDHEFQTVGGKQHRQHKQHSQQQHHGQHRNDGQRQNRSGGVSQSSSFTSPPSNNNQPRQQYNRPRAEYVEAPKPAENPWKTKPAVDLFSKNQEASQEAQNEQGGRPNINTSYNRRDNNNEERRVNSSSNNKRPDRPPSSRDNVNKGRPHNQNSAGGGGERKFK